MTLTDYTTYDDIRAVLGVSTDELEDSTLALELYSTNLELELADVSASVISEFDTVKAVPANDRTDAQAKFYKVARMFSSYAVAKQLGSALPLFGPKDITDGKASVSRFADSPYRETLKRVDDGYNRARAALVEAHSALLNASAGVRSSRTFLAVSSPSYDPVTGS